MGTVSINTDIVFQGLYLGLKLAVSAGVVGWGINIISRFFKMIAGG